MGRIHRFIFILFTVIVVIGVLKVNIEFNRLNGNARNKKNYEGIYNTGQRYCDAFGEVTVNAKTGNKLKIYINYKPIDIRLNIGKKIIYVNTSVLKQLKNKVSSFIHKF